MPRPLLILLLVIAAKVGCAQDLTGRKYFCYTDSVFHVGDVKILRDIYIYDGHEIRPPSFIVLDSVVEFLKANPQLSIEVDYFTDSVGSADYNLKYSEHLSFLLITYFHSKGIDTNRLASKGYGESLFIAPNSTPNGKDNFDGRKLNRRFEIKITRTDISYFQCLYKISFLNQTFEYGKRDSQDTIPIYDIQTGTIHSDWVVITTEGLRSNIINLLYCDSTHNEREALKVTSCSGDSIYEIKSIEIGAGVNEKIEFTMLGDSINVNASCTVFDFYKGGDIIWAIRQINFYEGEPLIFYLPFLKK